MCQLRNLPTQTPVGVPTQPPNSKFQSPTAVTSCLVKGIPPVKKTFSNTPATDSLAAFTASFSQKRKLDHASFFLPSPKKSCLSSLSAFPEKTLIEAVRSGNMEAIKFYLKTSDVNQAHSLLGNTALHFAVSTNQISVVLKLLSTHTIDVNPVNYAGCTPLLSAVQSGHSAMIRLLVSYGADVNVSDNQGFTVLHKAVLSGNVEILRFLLATQKCAVNAATFDQKLTPLHQAALHGNKSSVKLLLQHEAEVDSLSSNQTTPLHMAALKNHSSVVSLLLKSGALPNAQDIHERTALHYACLYGHLDSASTLCDQSTCSVTLEDFKNQTPLQLATRTGFEDLFQILAPKVRR